MQQELLNRRVNVSVKWKMEENLQNSGIVYTFGANLNINAYLLINGMAKYKKIDLDALDDEGVTDCQFNLIAKKAQEGKLGIWAE